MREEDIYGSKSRYEAFINNLNLLTKLPEPKSLRKYYCKNSINLQYFQKLNNHFDVKDISYIRRVRILQVLKIIVYLTEKDLIHCTRDDINAMVSYSNITNKATNSKRDFIKDLKCIWRVLFPEQDREGRIDETITPYIIRHLSRKVSKSQEKRRNDRLTPEEFQNILAFFSRDNQMQAYLMLSLESLGRPQEILYTKIKDYEFYDSFAKVWISEHGKEGTGFLQCIDSYPYVIEWFKQHPFHNNPNSFFFLAFGNRNKYSQLKNKDINKKLNHACKTLGIEKDITCYSLKRNGVTFRRRRGDSDVQIQHAARWTSTKQLQVYDMTTQEDAMQMELQKRGMQQSKTTNIQPTVKPCTFCSYINGFTAEFCTNCHRPLDRKKIEEMVQAHERMANSEILQRLIKMEKMYEQAISKGN